MSNNKNRQTKPIQSSQHREQVAGQISQANEVCGGHRSIQAGRFVSICLLAIGLIFLSACAPKPALWGSYQEAPLNKAYAVAPDGTSGAAWGHPSVEEAKDSAFWSCVANAANFGAYCKLIDVNGKAPVDNDNQGVL
jgi:hypothetical protein